MKKRAAFLAIALTAHPIASAATTRPAGVDPLTAESLRKPESSPRDHRWIANDGSAPEGWPHEAGYWVGMRIAEAYVARAQDTGAILKASGYGPSGNR